VRQTFLRSLGFWNGKERGGVTSKNVSDFLTIHHMDRTSSYAPAGAFYLSPLKTPKTGCWFSISPIGKNKLSKAIAIMCKECGIQGYKTNHSLRATAATRLYMSGIDEQLVMEQTGHRSTEGIRSYKRTTMEQKEVVSDKLSNTKRQRKQVAVREKPVENEASNTDIMTSSNHYSNTANLFLPTNLSKSGAFYL
jgi:integrase